MKGVIFNLLEDVVTAAHGEATWDRLLDAAGLEGAFTSLGNYPDENLIRLVGAAAAALNQPPDVVVRWFGRQALPRLAAKYPALFDGHRSTRPFILTLNVMINEVLDLARIESGRLSLALEAVAPGEIIRHAVDLVRPLGTPRGILIDADDEDGATWAGRRLQVDRSRFQQILLNLLSNAVKYNHDGGRVRVTCAEAASGRLRIGVSDTGAGIPPAKLARLFQPFERLDDGRHSRGRKRGRSGAARSGWSSRSPAACPRPPRLRGRHLRSRRGGTRASPERSCTSRTTSRTAG